MSGHTKGPWTMEDRGPQGVDILAKVDGWSSVPVRIAKVVPFKNAKNTAGVMAAAPDLLEAVNDFLHGYCDEPSELFHERMSDLAYKMRMASKKAEGKL